MDDTLRDFLVAVSSIGAIFGVVYILLMTRYRERMALMERGLSPKEFGNKVAIQSTTLRFGLLLIGVSIGILLGNYAGEHLNVPRQGAFIAMMFLFGGISLVTSYLIERKTNKM